MNARTLSREEKLEETVLRPLSSTGRGWYAWVGFLLVLIAWGLYGYSVQLRHGLVETGMRDQVIWGFYITNFVFFIGISHAGTLISAILRVTGAEWRRPVTRMAECITVVALMIGGLMPILDLGRPDRIPNLLLHGRFQSPIIWDFLSIGTYFTGSLIYLYLPLIPDFALIRDRLGPSASRLRRKVSTLLALGWTGTQEQRRRHQKALGIMMILIIPIAVSVHTVVSFIFSMTMRAGWNSTVFGPYFVVGAIFSGVAGIITVMFIFRRVDHLEEYITEKHFRYLGLLLLAMAVIYMYFTLARSSSPRGGGEGTPPRAVPGPLRLGLLDLRPGRDAAARGIDCSAVDAQYPRHCPGVGAGQRRDVAEALRHRHPLAGSAADALRLGQLQPDLGRDLDHGGVLRRLRLDLHALRQGLSPDLSLGGRRGLGEGARGSGRDEG